MKLNFLLTSIIAFTVLSLVISCSNKTEKPEKKATTEISEELQKKIDLDSIKSVALSEKTKRVTEEWIMYIALNSEVKRLEDYTLLDVINNSETVENVVDSLSITVPEIFQTKAVKARIVTLKTHSKLLKENSERVEPNPSEIEDLTARLKLDFKNLNIQLNEVFVIEESTVKSETNNR